MHNILRAKAKGPYYILNPKFHALVAQLEEHQTSNLDVVGSSPTEGI